MLQVHNSGRMSAADSPTAEKNSGAGAEVHLRQRPSHSGQEPAGRTSSFTL